MTHARLIDGPFAGARIDISNPDRDVLFVGWGEVRINREGRFEGDVLYRYEWFPGDVWRYVPKEDMSCAAPTAARITTPPT